MINTEDSTVIIHIPFNRVKIRFNGAEIDALQLAQGFSEAEYADGQRFPISCPLEEWLLDVTMNRAGGGGKNQNFYFVIDAPGPRCQDGQGLEFGDVNNIVSGL